jgi:hypothetical protein
MLRTFSKQKYFFSNYKAISESCKGFFSLKKIGLCKDAKDIRVLCENFPVFLVFLSYLLDQHWRFSESKVNWSNGPIGNKSSAIEKGASQWEQELCQRRVLPTKFSYKI